METSCPSQYAKSIYTSTLCKFRKLPLVALYFGPGRDFRVSLSNLALYVCVCAAPVAAVAVVVVFAVAVNVCACVCECLCCCGH